MTPPVCTPISLGRLAHPTHRFGAVHHVIQSHLLRLITGQLRLPDGSRAKRLLVSIACQHAKSTLCSQLLPACVLAQRPDAKLILLSYSDELASGHSFIARELVREFGSVMNPALALDPTARARNHWRTTAGGTFFASSILGTVTGRSADGLIIDDPHKGAEDSGNPAQTQKVFEAYRAVAETRLAPDGWVVLVQTRWSQTDLAARILEAEGDKWVTLQLPALAEEGDPLGRAPGEPLWPERYSLEWYEQLRAGFESSGLSHHWASLYQCDPRAAAGLCAFPPDYFGPHIWADGLPHPKQNPDALRVLTLDPAKSKNGDYSAFCDATLCQDRHLFCDMTLIREPLPRVYERAVAIVRQARDEGRPFDKMMIECNGFAEAVAIAIAERLATADIPLAIEMHTTGSRDEKAARISTSLGPLLAQKRLHFLGKSVGNKLTVKQLEEHPASAHDDGSDSLDMATQLINLILTGRKKAPAPTVLRAG